MNSNTTDMSPCDFTLWTDELSDLFDTITSDSGVGSDGHPAQWPHLDVKTAREMDLQLSWEDAVSITFLIVEDVKKAYSICR